MVLLLNIGLTRGEVGANGGGARVVVVGGVMGGNVTTGAPVTTAAPAATGVLEEPVACAPATAAAC